MARKTTIGLAGRLLGPLAQAARTTGTLAASTSIGWMLYSRLFVDHDLPLRPAIDAERRTLSTDGAGSIGYYAADHGKGRPLVLLHSINAAASSYEMMPLFERYRGERPVFAVDLPGFGASERGDRAYSPELYTEAIHHALRDISLSRQPVDLVALSLTCEFAALAALRAPDLVSSLTLISPTGFAMNEHQGLVRQLRALGFASAAHRVLSFPLWSQPIYDALVTQQSIDYFLRKSFLGRVDEGLRAHAWQTAHQADARFAPLAFLSGRLFTPDIRENVYAAVQRPVLVLYDRDPYSGFERLPSFVGDHANWQLARIDGTRGLPHFERPLETAQALDSFWSSNGRPRTGEPVRRIHPVH
jgi:pimeloyl-ACP methyl ester carboxylesterase